MYLPCKYSAKDAKNPDKSRTPYLPNANPELGCYDQALDLSRDKHTRFQPSRSVAWASSGGEVGAREQTTLLGKTLETDRENPLHRNKSSKLTVKIWDF
jgi:hypothetical protein